MVLQEKFDNSSFIESVLDLIGCILLQEATHFGGDAGPSLVEPCRLHVQEAREGSLHNQQNSGGSTSIVKIDSTNFISVSINYCKMAYLIWVRKWQKMLCKRDAKLNWCTEKNWNIRQLLHRIRDKWSSLIYYTFMLYEQL